jgi:hypothetical protein
VDRRRLELLFWAVILLGLFVYAWQGIGTHLLYYGFGVFTAYPAFSWEGSFLRAACSVPGGVVASLAALLAQAYRSPSLGALVVVGVLGMLAIGVRSLLRSIRADGWSDLVWAPPILALAIYNQYDNPLRVLLAIGLAVWLAVLCQSVPMRTPPVRLGAFAILFSLTYVAAGAAALLFGCVVCLTEALVRRRVVAATAEAGLSCGVPYVLGRFAFDLSPRAIYTAGTPWDGGQGVDLSSLSGQLTLALFIFVPALVLVACVGRFVTSGKKNPRPKRSAKDARPVSRWRTDDRLTFALRLLGVTIAAALCLTVSRSYIRYERSLNYWACQRDWERVIALAHRMRGKHAFTPSGVFDINRALAHQGRLGDELCSYPQDGTRALFLSFDNMTGRLQHTKLLELYLDLGCPNAAEKNAYELLDNEGPSPCVLEALVRIHLVKGEYESARIALGSLRSYAGSRQYVRRWQDVVSDPTRAESDPLIHSWRQVQGTADHAVAGISFETLLKGLLQEKPEHRLAFEYLMAHYLLKHQRAEFVRGLPLLKPLGYTQLPRHYAEALLVHSLETQTAADPQGWVIAPEVYAQFRDIRGIVKIARGNNQVAYDRLASQYGDSYTFYSMFNVCGVK